MFIITKLHNGIDLTYATSYIFNDDKKWLEGELKYQKEKGREVEKWDYDTDEYVLELNNGDKIEYQIQDISETIQGMIQVANYWNRNGVDGEDIEEITKQSFDIVEQYNYEKFVDKYHYINEFLENERPLFIK